MNLSVSSAVSVWRGSMRRRGPAKGDIPPSLVWDKLKGDCPAGLDRNYDVSAHIPVADRDMLLKVVQDAIKRHFALRIETETRMQSVYLATASETPSSQLQPAREDEEDMSGAGQGSIIGKGQTMEYVAFAIECLLNVPVLDATGLKGKYNYSASSKLPGADAAFDIASQLGLKLTPADRPVELLIVQKVGE